MGWLFAVATLFFIVYYMARFMTSEPQEGNYNHDPKLRDDARFHWFDALIALAAFPVGWFVLIIIMAIKIAKIASKKLDVKKK